MTDKELAERIKARHPHWEEHARRILGTEPTNETFELMSHAFSDGELAGYESHRARHQKTWQDFSWPPVACSHGGTMCGTCVEQFWEIWTHTKGRVEELEKENAELVLEISEL